MCMPTLTAVSVRQGHASQWNVPPVHSCVVPIILCSRVQVLLHRIPPERTLDPLKRWRPYDAQMVGR